MVFLIFFVFLIFGIALFLCRGDFLKPSVVFSGIIFCALIGTSYLAPIWDFSLSSTTCYLIGLSVAIFVLIDTIFSVVFTERKVAKDILVIETNTVIDIVMILLGVVTIIVHLRYLVSMYGRGTWLSLALQYRNNLVHNANELSMPSLLSRLIRYTSDVGFIYLYIFINNTIAGKKIRKSLLHLGSIVLYIIDSLLMGARGYIIYLIIASTVYVYFIYQRKNGWKLKSSIKLVKRILIIFVVVIFVFIISGNYMGRSTYGNIFYRIARYLGGGIPLLDEYIKSSASQSKSFGAATFPNFIIFLHRRFGSAFSSEQSIIYTFGFVVKNGISWGNIYTGFRRYYQDFGIIGSYICISIMSFFFSIYYNKLQRKKSSNNFDYALLIFGVMYRGPILFFIDEEFFRSFVHPSFILYLLEYFMFVMLITNIKKIRLRM